MRKTSLTIPVWILEEPDIEGFTERARVRGELARVSDAIADQLPDGCGVQIGTTHAGRKGDITRVRVSSGTKGYATLEVGEGVAIHEHLGTFHIPTWVLQEETHDAETLIAAAVERENDLHALIKDLEVRNAELERQLQESVDEPAEGTEPQGHGEEDSDDD